MSKKSSKYIPLNVIDLAISGDVDAINTVLKHYEEYIIKKSKRELLDENGNIHFCVDTELKRRVETTLIAAILGINIK